MRGARLSACSLTHASISPRTQATRPGEIDNRFGNFPANALLYNAWPHTRPIPVIIERPGLQKGGSNVLFLDGHVEFIAYPGKWPMTEKFIKALESLDELKVKE